ncbi:MAG: PQQ-like beta-propeller repeat protein [Treponema sp.]|nr:PQQ-like beta-propeller repeat protein [Treponema sp.]
MPETKKIESIEGKQLNEFAASEVKPEVFFETGSKIRSAVIADNDRLFFGNENCEFYAIDIAAKKILWTYSADLAVQTWPLIADGKIIFNAGNTLYILDSANGNELHKVTYPSDKTERVSHFRFAYNDSYTAVSNGVAWFPALDGAIVGVNIDTGGIVWTFPSEYPGYVTSGINILDDKLYYIDYSGSLCCVDIKSKQMVFRTQICENAFAPMHIDGGKIYIAGRSYKVYCIDAKSGEVIWSSFSHNDTTWFSGGSVTIGDTLYTCTSDEYALVSFDKNNGDFRRIYSTTVNAYTKPVLHGENIIVAATDVYSRRRSHIMEFDTKNHWKLWECRIEDGVLSSPSIYKGVLYFGSDSGKIYSVKLK